MNAKKTSNPSLPERLAEAEWVEPALGAMVAIFGILTAYAAWQAGVLGGDSAEQYFIGLSDLSEANSYYASGDQEYVQDNSLFIQLEIQDQLLEDADYTAIEDVLTPYFSEAANLAMEKGDWDEDIYAAEIYHDANILFENSAEAFIAAQELDALGDSYELLVLLLALGLGFAAWASLMRADGWTRYIFGGMGAILLVISIIYTLELLFTEPAEKATKCYDNQECYSQLYELEEDAGGEGEEE
jgi:hypothetical protein